MHALILAGGFGTRLASVVSDRPKPMALVAGKPFLAWLLDYLATHNFARVTFSLHHKAEMVRAFFGDAYRQITIDYVIEEEPLGTGGAIAFALNRLSLSSPIFVLNGDTFLALDYRAMFATHCERKRAMTMALRLVDEGSRYGVIESDGEYALRFNAHGKAGEALINAGVYLLEPSLFSTYALPKRFSFEQDFLMPKMNVLKPAAFVTSDYFIDIGVPEDYVRACEELSGRLRNEFPLPVGEG